MSEYKIALVDGVVEITVLANVSSEQLRGLMKEVAKTKPHYRSWDLSAGMTIDARDARELGEFGIALTARQPSGAVAIVAPSDLGFGMARMETAYRDDGKIRQRVFRSKAEARAWLMSRVEDGPA